MSWSSTREWEIRNREVVLPLLQTDLLEVMEAVVEHRLDQLTVEWRQETAVWS